jgi:hypothetical protein
MSKRLVGLPGVPQFRSGLLTMVIQLPPRKLVELRELMLGAGISEVGKNHER